MMHIIAGNCQCDVALALQQLYPYNPLIPASLYSFILYFSQAFHAQWTTTVSDQCLTSEIQHSKCGYF